MESKNPNSGLEELIRLSKETSKMEQDLAKRDQKLAKEEQELAKKKQRIQSLTEFKVSVALGQLKQVATPGIIEEVNSLRHMRSTGDLRKLISDLASELENRTGNMSRSNSDMVSIGRSVKTLAILIELLFSIE